MESGAGVPQLLFDDRGLGLLAVAQPGEEMALLKIMPTSTPPMPIQAAFAQAAPAALAGPQLLLVRPVGRALLFTVANCQ
jgi:hypothetical protein